MEKVASISDLRSLARARVPKVVFDYLDGGADGESALKRNREAFRDTLLRPVRLTDVSCRSLSVTLFGREYRAPFGFAPIGLANLIWPRAEQIGARIAAAENIPFVLSTASATTIEEIADIGGENTWFQLYPSSREAITFDLLSRAETAGCTVLVVTVDVAVPGKRNRDIRNGFGIPMRLGVGTSLDFARRPAWAVSTLRNGIPKFGNLACYMENGADSQSLASFMASNISSSFDWKALRRIRRRWSGALVVKGVLHSDDARRAVDEGLDGIVISNHGGRQLDASPATLDVISAIKDAVGQNATLMLDSGIRSGVDIVKALAAGADFTFCGRAWIYGVAARGERGTRRAVEILKDEAERTLGQVGCARVADMDSSYLMPPSPR